jgi:hypothetical protein
MKPTIGKTPICVPERFDSSYISQEVRKIFSRAYVLSYVHWNRETFKRAFREGEGPPMSDDTLAFHSRNPTMLFGKDLSLKSRKMGEVHFLADNWCVGTCSHEVFHSIESLRQVIYIVTRKGKLPEKKFSYRARHLTKPEEEALAYIMGHLSYNIYRWLWEVNPRKE